MLSRDFAIAYNLPIGRENDFKGVVDLISEKAYIWEGDETGVKVVELTTHALLSDGSYFTFIKNLANVITNALK